MPVLKTFSDKYKISYPLLSDVNSEVIKKFGIIDTRIPPDRKSFGVPYPGIYIINSDLVVEKKQFEITYYERPSAENILITHFDKDPESNIQKFSNSFLTGSISISDTTVFPAQMLNISIQIKLKEDFHIYGNPIPYGFIPFSIEMEKDSNMTLDPFIFPQTKKFTIQAINETFSILPGELKLISDLRIAKKPHYGQNQIHIIIKYQVCDEKMCMPPEEHRFTFPVNISKRI